MKKEQYTCDKCGKEWNLGYDPSAYILQHVSLTGAPIMGDNRINNELHFCYGCFSKYFAPLLTQIKE